MAIEGSQSRIPGDSAGGEVGREALASGGMLKRILGIGVAVLVALGAAWVWGASGRAGQLDQDANTLAADASNAINDVQDTP